MQYRCHHAAMVLRSMGWKTRVHAGDLPEAGVEGQYDLVVLHRVPFSAELKQFLMQAQTQGCRLVFDIDDLMFDLEHLESFQSNEYLNEPAVWRDHALRHRHTMDLCPVITVSTPELQKEAQKLFPEKTILVVHNAVSRSMTLRARFARIRRTRDSNLIRMTYVSGSHSHDKDFAGIAPALACVLRRYPHVHLRCIGPVGLPEALIPLKGQIETLPFQPPERIARLIADAAVNLAPLEITNRFTACKSAVKYLEAALCAVPTVGSATPGYAEVIVSGENGMLCGSDREWEETLNVLLEEPDARVAMGKRALKNVRNHHTIRFRRGEYGAVLRALHLPEKRGTA